MVKSHRIIRQTRKALLFDLSGLVKRSKHFQERIKEDPNFEVPEEDFRDLVNRAFRMVMRAVKFVDVWMEDVDFGEKAESATGTLNDQSALHIRETKEELTTTANEDSRASPNRKSNRYSYQSIQVSSLRDQHRESSSNRPRLSRSSKTFVRPGATEVDSQSPLYPSGSSRTSIRHRSSISSKQYQLRPRCLASEKLVIAEGHFLGLLGCFVGPHLQTRASIDLLVTLNGVIDSCHQLLAVVETIEQHHGAGSSALKHARDNTYGVFADFLQAAKDMLRPEIGEENGGASPEHLTWIREAATSCVRCTGECVATARSIIDTSGDFEIDPLALGKSSENGALLEPAEVGSGEKLDTSTTEYFPPEPTSPPPLPPPKELRFLPHLDTNVPESDAQISDPISQHSQPLDFLPPVSAISGPLCSFEDFSPTSQMSSDSVTSRVESIGVSSAVSGSTYVGSLRDSGRSGLSLTSTRATSPEMLSASFEEDCQAGEARILEKTFAHELTYSKDGQVSGGSLPALVECLTTHDTTPDVLFTSTFYLTFRLFSKPVEFAQALINRFDHVNDSPQISLPVRLRVYNVFKQWLETHWRNDCDTPALTYILPFALGPLSTTLPSAGKRLTELVDKVSSSKSLLVPRLVSSIGKTNTAHASYITPGTPLPPLIITKSQLTALKNWKMHGTSLSILDFDPLELARQITIKESRIFCMILPEELLASEWTKKTASMAVNVRAMSTISTDLANLVADCILRMEDPRVRAKSIKHWIKIADKCLELNNYDSLIAIICSLESATISRLKRTWDMVSAKTKATLENLRGVVELSRNYAVLRQRLQNHVPPCLPFVGIYLTDLTFVDIGNPSMRQLPSDGDEKGIEVINFDKHMKTAKIIGELQRFQIPYRLQEQVDMQIWLQDQLIRVRSPNENTTNQFYRRSLLLEPRESHTSRESDFSKISSEVQTTKPDKTPLLSFKWASNHQKDRLKQEASLSRQISLDEPLGSEQRFSSAVHEHTLQ